MVELPHPEELFSGGYYRPDQFVDAWDTAAGDKTVLVEWGREGDEFDAQTQASAEGSREGRIRRDCVRLALVVFMVRLA